MKEKLLTICIVTGSRAEYGLLTPLLELIREDKALELQIIATGMHLSPVFGSTYQEIERDGFVINEKVDIQLTKDTNTAIARSTGLGMIGLAEALEKLQPDWIVLLGDRFESFAAASTAHLMKIPIAHLHGGELTEGAVDDAFRHAITKMAWLHFTAAEEYRQRVIQLGEAPERVFNVGAIGLDNIKKLPVISQQELEKQLDFEGIDNAFLVTFHPATMENASAEQQVKELLTAFDNFPDYKIIFTFPNADANGRAIIRLLEEYVKNNPGRAKAYTSLGQLRYLSLLKYVRVMVGNSSSGLIEAPSFGLPVVNIGSRQDGRLKPRSVIDAFPNKINIEQAVQKALSKSFRDNCNSQANPYGHGDAAEQILKQIKKFGKLNTTVKKFFDLRHA
jgi:UDP-hydrolysing UDP-N-acetyl-D-glucosamine 2-epimerase